MKPSPSPESVLAEVELRSPHLAAIVVSLRRALRQMVSIGQERVRYGGLVYGADEIGVFARTRHVTIEIGNGVDLADPHGVLEGSGRTRRHIVVRSLDDVATKHVLEYVARSIEARGAQAGGVSEVG
ncbi:MAG: DUF1801 domain-containing protein [Spirochaetales bacterium]|nr:DUF1801 domain-containing protein [Spirochaetales bacterium]